MNTYGQYLLHSIESSDQATELAINWQQWASEQDLSYGELAEWQDIFEQLGAKYDLTDEFKENGIL